MKFINVLTSSSKVLFFGPKPSTIKCYKVAYSQSRVLCGRTDVMKIIVTNSNYGNACKTTPHRIYSCFGECEPDLYINENKYIRFKVLLNKVKSKTY